jgi:hypothetical protein
MTTFAQWYCNCASHGAPGCNVVPKEDYDVLALRVTKAERESLDIHSAGSEMAELYTAVAAELARSRRMHDETSVKWQTRVDQCDALAAELAGCKQQLAVAPTYEKMMAHHGVQEERIRELEAAMQSVMDASFSQDAAYKIAERALPSQETPVRRAHSKSEYKRLTTLGVECLPPETPPKYGTCSDCGGMGGAHLTNCRHWHRSVAENSCEGGK